MYSLGFISVFILIFALLDVAAIIGGGSIGRMMWEIWALIALLIPARPVMDGWALWRALLVKLLYVVGPACLLYWIFKLTVIWDWLERWPLRQRCVFAFGALVPVFSVGHWAAAGGDKRDAVLFLLLVTYLCPLCIWQQTTRRRMRAITIDPRNRFASGMWAAVTKVVGFVFGWKEARPDDEPYGRSAEADAEEANLL